jgi:hypothetical protein
MLIGFDDPDMGGFRVFGQPDQVVRESADLSRRPPKLGETPRRFSTSEVEK